MLGRSNIRGIEKKVEEEVECPLCQKPFGLSLIEAHASTCGEPPAEIPTQQPTVNSSKGKRRYNQKNEDVTEIIDTSDEEVKVPRITSRSNRRERTPPSCVRCMLCKALFKEGDEYLIHVKDCEIKSRESPSMASIKSTTPGTGEKVQNPNGASSNHMRMSSSPVTRLTSVFEQLEGGSM